jgi:hypothetical protein
MPKHQTPKELSATEKSGMDLLRRTSVTAQEWRGPLPPPDHHCNHCGRPTVETGWLIEKPMKSRPMWLICNWSFGWTEDSTKAIRFSRREDAEQIATMFENADVRITEHQWL